MTKCLFGFGLIDRMCFLSCRGFGKERSRPADNAPLKHSELGKRDFHAVFAWKFNLAPFGLTLGQWYSKWCEMG